MTLCVITYNLGRVNGATQAYSIIEKEIEKRCRERYEEYKKRMQNE